MPALMNDEDVVAARPIRLARIGWACAAAVLAVFIVIALVMKQHNAGAHFLADDQLGTLVIGIILAGLFVMPTRPRLRADAEGVHLRSFLGGWRHVPWELVVRIDFPRKVRFARVVLPAEESLAIYAVSRLDKRESVATMNQLRALHAKFGPTPR
ncbi:MAG TPA: PH domain-containing protein [Jatrophihabitans sp.]|jgi:hypothetical protein